MTTMPDGNPQTTPPDILSEQARDLWSQLGSFVASFLLAVVCREAGVSTRELEDRLPRDPAFRAAWQTAWRDAAAEHLPAAAGYMLKREVEENPHVVAFLRELRDALHEWVQ